MMICHTAEQKKLYERGYPYLAMLVDGHKDDKKPEASAGKVFKDYFGAYHVKWPRLTAAAFVRGGASHEPVTDDEARAIIAKRITDEDDHSWFENAALVFALEALTSTNVVLDAITKGLEDLPKKRWAGGHDDGDPALLAYFTGLLLLRAEKPEAFAKRLEALHAAMVKANVALGEESVRGGLDLALHGNAGAARTLASSHWQYWHYYVMVDDADVHLARLANHAKSDWVPESRILFLAGERMLPVYTTPKALRQGKRLPRILGDFGMFAHDDVLALMVSMVGVKGAGDAPAEYFRENRAYARPKLEKIARRDGVDALKAKAALQIPELVD